MKRIAIFAFVLLLPQSQTAFAGVPETETCVRDLVAKNARQDADSAALAKTITDECMTKFDPKLQQKVLIGSASTGDVAFWYKAYGTFNDLAFALLQEARGEAIHLIK